MKSVDKEKNRRLTIHSVEITEILTSLFIQKFRESNGFTKELILRNIFSEREIFSFFQTAVLAKKSGSMIKFVKMIRKKKEICRLRKKIVNPAICKKKKIMKQEKIT